MKLHHLPLLLTALLPLASGAQAQTETPAAGGAAAKVQLNANDKQSVKTMSEAQIAVIHLADVQKNGINVSDSVKDLAKKVLDDANTSWGELGTASQSKGGEMAKTDTSNNEKRNLEELKKAPAGKGDKIFLHALERELKRLAGVTANFAKSATDPDLKAFYTKWQPTFAAHGEAANKAQADAGKTKK